jgi:hypothetical protein
MSLVMLTELPKGKFFRPSVALKAAIELCPVILTMGFHLRKEEK